MNKKPNKKKKEPLTKSKSKSTHKRANTFNSSQFSAIDQKLQRNFASSSVCDLFRHSSIKLPKFQNASIVISTSRPAKKKKLQKAGASLGVVSNPNNKKKVKRQKLNSKSKPKIIKQIEPYEYVFLHPSHSNSDIVFSNEDTKRQSQIPYYNQCEKRNTNSQYLPIKFEQQYSIGKKVLSKKIQARNKLPSNRNANQIKIVCENKNKKISCLTEPQLQNQALRNSIKQKYWIQYQAATKIQKVFRGYLTRKILNKYIFHEEQKLSRRIEQIKGKSFGRTLNGQQFRKIITFDELQQFEDSFEAEQHSREQLNSFKRAKTIKNSYDRSGDISLNTFQDDSKNQFDISQFQSNLNIGERGRDDQFEQQDSQCLKKQIRERIKHYKSYPQNYQQSSKKGVDNEQEQQQSQQQQEQSYEQQASSDNEEPNLLAYRHQQPIYSHEQISQFLNEESEQEYQEEQDEYEPNVIFETNEEYIQSRKSSLQNKNSTKNQLAAARSNKSRASNQKSYFNEHKQENRNGSNQNFQQNLPLKRNSFQPKGFVQQDSIQQQRKLSFQNDSFKKSAVKPKIQIPRLPTQHFRFEKQKQSEEPITNPSQKMHTDISQPYPCNYNLTFHSDEDNKLLTETYSFPIQQKQINSRAFRSQQRTKNQKTEAKQLINFNLQQNSQFDGLNRRERMIRKVFSKQMKSNTDSNSSHQLNSISKQDVKKLKASQKKRWQQISKMIADQVKQNELKNSQLSSFMRSIQQMCQKNKQSLSQQEFDQQSNQTPTTTIEAHIGYNQLTQSSSKNNLQTIEFQQFAQNQSQKRNSQKSNQFKKKNLKIQIVNGDVTNQERLSLSKSKHNKQKSFKKGASQNKFEESFSPRNIAQPVFSKPILAISQKRKSKEEINQLTKLRFNQFQDQQCQQNLKSDSFVSSSKLSEIQNHVNQNKRSQLKNFLVENIQNDSLNQMLKLRQQLLLRRQSQMLVKLNQELSTGKLSQPQFIKKLGVLTSKFEQEKESIDKARQDIEKGYQAAMGLVRQAYKDAKKLGAKINFCKSSGNMKIKQTKILQSLIVDQFQCFTPKNKSSAYNNLKIQQVIQRSEPQKQTASFIFENPKKYEDEFSQSSSVQFTQDQLQRFRKIKAYDYQFAELNKNITIGDQFMKQHIVQSNNDQTKYQQARKSIQNQDQGSISSARSIESLGKIKLTSQAYRQVYEVEIDDGEIFRIEKLYPQYHPVKDKLAQLQLQKIIYECAIQILERPILNQKLLDRSYLTRPKKITVQQQQLFINILEKHFPEDSVLLKKLNQKISPLPSELLKCMRIQFNQQGDPDQTLNDTQNQSEDDNDYQQIGKYQFIIGQDVCAQSLSQFRNIIQAEQSKPNNLTFKATLKQKFVTKQSLKNSRESQQQGKQKVNQQVISFQQLNEKFNFEEKSVRYMTQRERFIQNKIKHTKGLRWQILNIEVHSIFDAWNEQIIQLRSKKSGFSGIGLNQLTISVMDQNKMLNLEQVKPIMKQGKQKVLSILNDDSDLNQKMLKQNFQEMCQTDSTWIFYADQALSYGLQIGYMVEQQLFNECARQIMKKIIGLQVNYFNGQQNSDVNSSSDQQYEQYEAKHFRDDQSGSDSGYY